MRRSVMAVLVLVAASLACGGGGVRVVNFGGDDLCSNLVNYCVQVKCTVENTSSSPQTATIVYRMEQDDGHAGKFEESVTLGAGEQQTFKHPFKDATLLGGVGRVSCSVR